MIIEIPANKAMEAFFVFTGEIFRGWSITKLPAVTNKDLIHISAGELKFKTKHDLDRLRSIAEVRTQWRRLSANI